MTAFRENPFVYLGVSPSSSRSEILEKAEEKALTEDPDEVAKYRSILTNPGKRLESELRYLPGVSDEEANEILALLGKDPVSLCTWSKERLSGIARANALAQALPSFPETNEPGFSSLIRDIAESFESQDIAELASLVNGARSRAHFPEVKDTDRIPEALKEIRWDYQKAIEARFNSIQSRRVARILTGLFPPKGEQAGIIPGLIDDLLSSYEVSVQSFAEKEMASAAELLRQIPAECRNGHLTRRGVFALTMLYRVTVNWNSVTLPLQRFRQAKGEACRQTESLFTAVRKLAYYLATDLNCVDAAYLLVRRVLSQLLVSPVLEKHYRYDLESIAGMRKGKGAASGSDTIPEQKTVSSLEPAEAKGFKGIPLLVTDIVPTEEDEAAFRAPEPRTAVSASRLPGFFSSLQSRLPKKHRKLWLIAAVILLIVWMKGCVFSSDEDYADYSGGGYRSGGAYSDDDESYEEEQREKEAREAEEEAELEREEAEEEAREEAEEEARERQAALEAQFEAEQEEERLRELEREEEMQRQLDEQRRRTQELENELEEEQERSRRSSLYGY